MSDSFVQLPDDAANTGKQIRTQTRTVGVETVHEHFFHVVDPDDADLANVAANAASVTLQAANPDRRGLIIYNDSADSQLYAKLGATASVTSYSMLVPPGEGWTLPFPCYTGIVDGIWTNPGGGAVSGTARVTELISTNA